MLTNVLRDINVVKFKQTKFRFNSKGMLSTCNVKGKMKNCNVTAVIVICSGIGVIVKYYDKIVLVKCNVYK